MEHLHQLARRYTTGVRRTLNHYKYSRYACTPTNPAGRRPYTLFYTVRVLSQMEKHTLPGVTPRRMPNLLTLAWREDRTAVLVMAAAFLVLLLSVTARDILGTWRF